MPRHVHIIRRWSNRRMHAMRNLRRRAAAYQAAIWWAAGMPADERRAFAERCADCVA